MALEVICMSFLVMLFGLALAFFGYRLFLILLPVWGFFIGFGFGTQAMTQLFGYGFLSTVTSWVVGVVVGIVFGLLSYLFYFVGVALLSAALGYVLGVGVMNALGSTGALAFLVGFAVAVVFAFVVLRWNWQKYAIIIVSGLTGAAISVGGLLLPFGVFDLEDFASGAPIASLLKESPLWLFFWLILALLAIIVQWRAGRKVDYFAAAVTAPIEPGTRAPEPISATPSSGALAEAPSAAAVGVAAGAATIAAVHAEEPVAEEAALPVTEDIPVERGGEVVEAAAVGVVAETLETGDETAGNEVVMLEETVVSEEAPLKVEEPEEAVVNLTELDLPADQMRYLKRELEYVEGIGPVYAGKLNAIGLITAYDLLSKGATRKGRAEISEQSGITGTLILKWVNHTDLFRLKGVGSEYADLLEAAGVDTVVELAHRNAVNLFNKMVETNAEKKLVRQVPTAEHVADWVEQAKGLPREISY